MANTHATTYYAIQEPGSEKYLVKSSDEWVDLYTFCMTVNKNLKDENKVMSIITSPRAVRVHTLSGLAPHHSLASQPRKWPKSGLIDMAFQNHVYLFEDGRWYKVGYHQAEPFTPILVLTDKEILELTDEMGYLPPITDMEQIRKLTPQIGDLIQNSSYLRQIIAVQDDTGDNPMGHGVPVLELFVLGEMYGDDLCLVSPRPIRPTTKRLTSGIMDSNIKRYFRKGG